jgi:hypothetical protein
MKVSKKELRKIIREERARLLRESIVDMVGFEDVIAKASGLIGDAFLEQMSMLPGESPEVLADLGIDLATWDDALNEAVLELDSAVGNAIAETVQNIEAALTSGDYAGATSRRTGEY